MATITTIDASDLISDSRSVINTNFTNLNTDKLETLSNDGAGSGIAKAKSGTDSPLKSLIGGTNISLSDGADAITINQTGGGETNTSSNVGTAGVGVFKQKTGLDFEFKKINAGSTKITITDDTGNDELDVDVAEANVDIGNLGGGGIDGITPTTTKGDVMVENGSNVVRLAVGSDGAALHADSGEATGLLWDTNGNVFTEHENSGSITASTNDDTTFTAGFQAAVIEIHYYLQGNDGGSATYAHGTAVYNGTTLKSNLQTYQQLASGGTVTAAVEALMNTSAPSSGGNNAVIGLSITSITSTQFTVRAANSGGSAAGVAIYNVKAFR